MLLKCFYCPSVQKGKVNHIKHFPYSLIVSLQHFAALCTPACDELSSPTIDMSSSNTPRLCMHCTTETSEVHPRRPRHLPLALRNKHNCDLSSSSQDYHLTSKTPSPLAQLSSPRWDKGQEPSCRTYLFSPCRHRLTAVASQ